MIEKQSHHHAHNASYNARDGTCSWFFSNAFLTHSDCFKRGSLVLFSRVLRFRLKVTIYNTIRLIWRAFGSIGGQLFKGSLMLPSYLYLVCNSNYEWLILFRLGVV